MKNQYRVVSKSVQVTQYSEPKTIINSETGEEQVLEPEPIAGTTTFKVELSTVDMNGVNSVVGTTYVTLDRLTEYTGEAKLEIESKLAEMGLIEPKEQSDLDYAKQQRWARIIAIRDGLEGEGFTYLEKPFDSDERSIMRIGITAQAALAAKVNDVDFQVDWTCADNSVISLSREQIIDLPCALAAHANTIHLQARTLKKALDDAGSIAEVEMVRWPGVEYEVHTAI